MHNLFFVEVRYLFTCWSSLLVSN